MRFSHHPGTVAATTVDRVIPVSAPPRVRSWLRSAPDGVLRVLHRGADAAYVELGGRCVGLLGRHAVPVPCGLRSELSRVEVGEAALVGGRLHVDGEPVLVGRLVDVRVPRLRVAATRPAPAPDEVRTVGRGDGLTPYDDDVLCGWLAVHRAAGLATPEVDDAVRAQSHRTTLLSATLLECATHGEVLPQFAAWLAARGTAEEQAAAATLGAVGHSSGRGLLAGARLALAHLDPSAPAEGAA